MIIVSVMVIYTFISQLDQGTCTVAAHPADVTTAPAGPRKMPSQDTPSRRWPRETHPHLSRKLPRPTVSTIHAGQASLTFGQPNLGAVAALLYSCYIIA